MSINKRKPEPENELATHAKRSTAAVDFSGIRLPVEDLMAVLRADAGLQPADWDRLQDLHGQYDAGTLSRRDFVDNMAAIIGSTNKLFTMVKMALSKSASVAALGADAILPLRRIALQRMSSTTSSASSSSTPGGHEVASILGPNRPPSSSRTRSGPGVASPSTPAIHTLVHSFHCDDDDCDRPKCRELKLVLKRMEAHVGTCPAWRTPLGVPVKECKTCRLWKTLTRTVDTRNRAAQPQAAQPQAAQPQEVRSSSPASTLQ